MDISVVENEIYDFCSEYFEEELIIAQDCQDFLEDFDLYIPKENYTVMPTFLDAIIKRFNVLDSSFISPTLTKTNKDIQSLKKVLNALIKKTLDPKEVFKSEFLKYSYVLCDSKDFNNYKKLEKVYFENFKKIFYEEKKNLINDISLVLNIKSYYCDKLLWKEARASNFIKKHFQVNKISEVLNSKNYLINAVSLMRPYTKEYDYYMSCIRIYK